MLIRQLHQLLIWYTDQTKQVLQYLSEHEWSWSNRVNKIPMDFQHQRGQSEITGKHRNNRKKLDGNIKLPFYWRNSPFIGFLNIIRWKLSTFLYTRCPNFQHFDWTRMDTHQWFQTQVTMTGTHWLTVEENQRLLSLCWEPALQLKLRRYFTYAETSRLAYNHIGIFLLSERCSARWRHYFGLLSQNLRLLLPLASAMTPQEFNGSGKNYALFTQAYVLNKFKILNPGTKSWRIKTTIVKRRRVILFMGDILQENSNLTFDRFVVEWREWACINMH